MLSYRNTFLSIEPLWRAARITRLLLRTLGGFPSLEVDQELHLLFKQHARRTRRWLCRRLGLTEDPRGLVGHSFEAFTCSLCQDIMS